MVSKRWKITSGGSRRRAIKSSRLLILARTKSEETKMIFFEAEDNREELIYQS
jgi:hypothetical protein